MRTDSNLSVGKRFQEQGVFFADNDYCNIFSLNFLRGSHAPLTAPNSVVITAPMAEKYFGTTDVVGRPLYYDNKLVLQITAVIDKIPANSDNQFDFLISFESLFAAESQPISDFIKNDWTFNPCTSYVLLNPGQKSSSIDPLLNKVLYRYGNDRNRQMNTVYLQPLEQVHLYAAKIEGNPSNNSITYIYIFAAIAFLVLLIANVNYINLSIARSVSRAKEIGMRKILGAGKKQLAGLFLIETLLTSFIAFIISFAIALPGLVVLNQLTGKTLTWFSLLNTQTILLFVVLFPVISLLSGLYPSFFLARFGLIESIKGKWGETFKKNTIRKGLLVVQFVVSIILITGAIVISQQLNYIRNKPLGFQKQQVIVVPIFGRSASSISFGVDGPMRQRMNTFSNECTKFSKIQAVTATSAMPGNGFVNGLVIPQGRSEKDNIFLPWVSVDYNFIEAMHIKLLAGRQFSKATGSDHIRAFILSESAVRSFGWGKPEDAIGKQITRGDEKSGKKGQVIGVIADFDFNPLDQPVQPLIMDVNAPRFSQFAITVQPGHIPETIAFIRKTWEAIFPERVFDYSFLDKDIDNQYSNKENLSKLISYFALAAIFLSCLGLFSLASFLVGQRSKEVAVRKVLGARVLGLLVLLCTDFLKLVLIAFVIASPLAWFIMRRWLQDFSYRITIQWWVFGVVGLLVAFIAFITVSFQSIKIASTNPTESLKSE
jgi:putative ABC transport system permease protein